MPIAWAAPLAAALTFTSVALPLVAPSVDVVPVHPSVAARGWVAFVAQDGKKRCEVSLWRVTRERAEGAFRQPCERADAFYNVIPAPDGTSAELVALGADGLTRVFPGPRAKLARQPTFAAVPPTVRSPGSNLWLAVPDPTAPLRLAIPSFTEIAIWEREPPATGATEPTSHAEPSAREPEDERWRRVERYRIAVDARYNPRIGRDSLSPDFALLTHLRLPKWQIGRIATTTPAGLLYAVENEVTGTRILDGDDPGDVFKVEKVLFPDDPEGNDPRLVRGNRIEDIDADGNLDIAMVAARGGITHLETAFDVWFGPLDESLQRAPDVRFRGTGAAVGTELVDVDGDHKLEALRPRVEVSIAAFVRILLFGEVRIDYDLYDLIRGERDDVAPFCSFARNFPVDLEGLSAKSVPLFTTDGDFDGDGLRDVLTGEGTKGYAILRGRRSDPGRWCVAPGEATPIPVTRPEALTVHDLDGDAASDLIAVHGTGGKDSTVEVLFADRTPGAPSLRAEPAH
ncbi:MAG: VCBS repeat-containing protein [bacterium]